MVAVAAFVIRCVIPFLVSRLTEARILLCAVFVATAAFVLLPFFSNPYALAAIAFLLGLGVGSTAPMTMSLIYFLAPPNRMAEAMGVHKALRNATQLAVPVVFGSVGAALGYSAVFLSNAAVLAVSGFFLRKVGLAVTNKR
jgi:MFS family permease